MHGTTNRQRVAILSRDPAMPMIGPGFHPLLLAPRPDQVVRAQQDVAGIIVDSVGLAYDEALVLFAAAVEVTLPLVIRVESARIALVRLATGVERAGAIIDHQAVPTERIGDVLRVLVSSSIRHGPLWLGTAPVPLPHLRADHLRLLALMARHPASTGDVLAHHADRSRGDLYRALRDLRHMMGATHLHRFGDLWPRVCSFLAQA